MTKYIGEDIDSILRNRKIGIDLAQEGSESSGIIIYDSNGEIIETRVAVDNRVRIERYHLQEDENQQWYDDIKVNLIGTAGGTNRPGIEEHERPWLAESHWSRKAAEKAIGDAMGVESDWFSNPRFWVAVGLLIIGGFTVGYSFSEVIVKIVEWMMS